MLCYETPQGPVLDKQAAGSDTHGVAVDAQPLGFDKQAAELETFHIFSCEP
jgi:hypothetical protein